MRNLLRLVVVLFATTTFAQAGHLMAGIGSVNSSMGGAATGQPIDISGAIQWNPATISTFDNTILNVDIGMFSASPELSSSIPAGMMGAGSPEVKGTTTDDKGASPLPAIAMVFGKPDSKLTFGASIFGVSGFGADFAAETNLPVDESGDPNPNWDPNNSNPISYPQNMGGFGHIKSNYMLMQVGFTVAYKVTDKISLGVTPLFNYGALEIAPNPTASPDMTASRKGYPVSSSTSTTGLGAQVGVFFDSGKGLKFGASYKTKQDLSELEFNNTYIDGSDAIDNKFDMDFPAIYSVGMGYSNKTIDFALDYRLVDYENTNGFADIGWTNTASVKGFGWENMIIVSVGLQYKGFEKLPLRVGYTYSSNPINEEVAFYSVPTPAIIKNAFQFGLTYKMNEKMNINGVYHYGTSNGKTEGELLNPMLLLH